MNKYQYSGPVYKFDTLVAGKWIAETYAPSKAKARSNMIYQYKKNNNLLPSSKITLPGDIIERG